VTVGVTGNLTGIRRWLRLELPGAGVGAGADGSKFIIAGEAGFFQFKVFPAGLEEGRAKVRRCWSRGESLAKGYTCHTEDLGSFYYYQAGVQP